MRKKDNLDTKKVVFIFIVLSIVLCAVFFFKEVNQIKADVEQNKKEIENLNKSYTSLTKGIDSSFASLRDKMENLSSQMSAILVTSQRESSMRQSHTNLPQERSNELDHLLSRVQNQQRIIRKREDNQSRRDEEEKPKREDNQSRRDEEEKQKREANRSLFEFMNGTVE